jgi:hypothetical protein
MDAPRQSLKEIQAGERLHWRKVVTLGKLNIHTRDSFNATMRVGKA